MIYIKATQNEETVLKIVAVSCELIPYSKYEIVIKYKYYQRTAKEVQESSCKVDLSTTQLYITTYHKY